MCPKSEEKKHTHTCTKKHVNRAPKMLYSIEAVTGLIAVVNASSLSFSDASFRLYSSPKCTGRSRKPRIYLAFSHQVRIFWNKKIDGNRRLKRAYVCDSSTYAPFISFVALKKSEKMNEKMGKR